MKRFFIIAAAILSVLSCNNSFAQTGVTREGKTFMRQADTTAPKDIPTDYVWRDNKGIDHTLYLHQYKGGDKAGQWTCYILKQSKSGKDYRQYLKEGPEIAAAILKELNMNP